MNGKQKGVFAATALQQGWNQLRRHSPQRYGGKKANLLRVQQFSAIPDLLPASTSMFEKQMDEYV